MKINNCKKCNSSNVDWEFKDSIGCIAYVECYDCKEIGPLSKNHGIDRDSAIKEAINLWNYTIGVKILDAHIFNVDDLDKLMTPESKKKAEVDFRKFFPEGTPEIMCTSESEESETEWLKPVNLDDFE